MTDKEKLNAIKRGWVGPKAVAKLRKQLAAALEEYDSLKAKLKNATCYRYDYHGGNEEE